MVLPLKPQPVVLCTKDVQVKALEELLELLIESQSATAGLSICDSPNRLSLQVTFSSTMGEEDGRKSKSVNHGYQTATLFHPLGTCSLERTSIVADMAGEKDVPTMSHNSSTERRASSGCC